MKKINLGLLLLLVFLSTKINGQSFYFDICKISCEKCKPDFYNKVEYLADPKKQIVIRTFTGSGNKTVHSFTDCNIIDKNNWVCDPIKEIRNKFPSIVTNPEAGKQFATNGVAYWINSSELEKNESYCVWDKNILGKYILRK
jgi:hypothetical protein